MSRAGLAPEFVDAAQRVAEVAARYADAVDREARFPDETLAALRAARLMGAAAPRSVGGLELGVRQIARICRTIGAACGSSGMVFAMHQIQIACLARHGLHVVALRRHLAEACDRQLLLASITSEVGVGGDVRRSVCAVEREGETVRVVKQATTVSYGARADGFLMTARRNGSAAPTDQVLVYAPRRDVVLEQRGAWDTLGMRGTCSPPFLVTALTTPENVFDVPYTDIVSGTMLPYAHILWASCWLGIAEDAVRRASAFVRKQARENPGVTPPAATRLAELAARFQGASTAFDSVAEECDGLLRFGDEGRAELSRVHHLLALNNLKVDTSRQVVDVVGRALDICGMAGYSNAGPWSLGRHLRDAHSAALMISNDRILATNASLLSVHKGDPVV